MCCKILFYNQWGSDSHRILSIFKIDLHSCGFQSVGKAVRISLPIKDKKTPKVEQGISIIRTVTQSRDITFTARRCDGAEQKAII